ncbi:MULTISPECIES: dTDP-4-dehydrorhamnose 3,5-epimerase family protein [unclassified Beijerinckia]|uniref:dTDP-4-dehydrorhamnose 3,5-epimerase family protein n=1 Tax=unclassified Beijerinckia TaxID=2638183 RepID=UPI00089CBAD0|nr:MULTISPECIES: dTDP-4-dehydrorhamnose 3,5-epimerase family protein [unclassified Beijerinckia]MDH7796124.1 dTDP-4-dehydrorhamnose 3,5-epimerase [Beijerinckia sp. GAS462]SEC31374.1 dTDP-4-dehydrorhamnose 3,5-epimerase [Beijerinckia sp. 28-YEA-48]
MRFAATKIAGVTLITLEPHRDERGFFARIYCPEEFAAAGIDFTSTQINLSRNPARHTLRGLHYQDAPFAEAKVVRPVRGSIYDVAVDLRRDSATYGQWVAQELSAERGDALYIAEGLAHGFLTLEPDTDVVYQMGRPYVPGQARGLRYDDPALAISWPAAPAMIGTQDLNWPAFVR